MRKPVVFYGYFSGWFSYSAVCREIARFLWESDIDLILCDLAEGRGPRDAYTKKLPRVPGRIQEGVTRGITAMNHGWNLGSWEECSAHGTSLFFGRPELARALPRHEHRVCYSVVDPDPAPSDWVRALHDVADVVLTPSRWSRDALISGGLGMRVKIVRHGVDPEVFYPPKGAVEYDAKLRYFCSSESGNRKGLEELMTALGRLYERGVFSGEDLVVHTPYNTVIERFLDMDPWGVDVGFEKKPVGAPDKMAQLLRETELLLVPSRAEGFGLQGLEALSCGTPIVAPNATGMREYLSTKTPGLARVRVTRARPLYPEDPELADNGFAPTITPGGLTTVIGEALENLPKLKRAARRNAPKIAQRNAWSNVLREDGLIDELRCS